MIRYPINGEKASLPPRNAFNMKIINWETNYSMMFLIITYVSKYCKVNCKKEVSL